MSLDTFLLFLNFLRCKVLSRSAIRESTRIYRVYKQSHIVSNLGKHKVSKYYENYCRPHFTQFIVNFGYIQYVNPLK